MTARVLVVEGDPSVRTEVRTALEGSGFEVEGVVDGADAQAAFDVGDYDVVLIDVEMPTKDGVQVCRDIRSTSSVPIVLLTSPSDPTDVVDGLRVGADDYLTKPIESVSLVGRVRALVDRAASSRWTVGDVHVDRPMSIAEQTGRQVDLTRIEIRLLAALASSSGEVVSRTDLLRRVWGYDVPHDERVVDVAVERLRAKLGDLADPPHISSERSGHRFDPS